MRKLRMTDMGKLSDVLDEGLGWKMNRDECRPQGREYVMPWSKGTQQPVVLPTDVARQVASVCLAYKRALDLLVELGATLSDDKFRCECDENSENSEEAVKCLGCRLEQATFRDGFYEPDCYDEELEKNEASSHRAVVDTRR